MAGAEPQKDGQTFRVGVSTDWWHASYPLASVVVSTDRCVVNMAFGMKRFEVERSAVAEVSVRRGWFRKVRFERADGRALVSVWTPDREVLVRALVHHRWPLEPPDPT